MGVVYALAVSKTGSGRGRVWIGYAGQGVDYFDVPAVPGGPLDLQRVSRTENYIVRGLAVGVDRLWVLTTSELRRYELTGDFEASYTVPAQPADRAHHPVDVAADGTVWVGTVNGVRAYRPNGTFQDFNTANSPLADDDVRTVRNDHLTGVVWIATGGGLNRFDPGYVPPPPPRLESLDLSVYPNPARLTGLGVQLKLSGNASGYRGGIYDLGGRLIRNFKARVNGTVIWDGRDANGDLAAPGIYFVRVEAGGATGTVRVAVVH
jgi:hypothetical protein